MKRRKALKNIGLGISAGLVLPTWLSACKKDEDPKPEIDYPGVVAIIGGGAAGLYAADILHAKGINVKIFEASDRLGGRVRSLGIFDKPTASLLFDPENLLSSDYPTDLGADRIFGSDAVFAKFIGQQNVPSVEFSSSAASRYMLDGAVVDETTAQSNSNFVAAQNFFNNFSGYLGGNTTVEQAIQAAGINPTMYAILNAWIGNAHGTNNSRLGATGVAESLRLLTRNKSELLLTRNSMQDALLSRFDNVVLKASLNTVVRNINYQNATTITLSGTRTVNGATEAFSEEVNRVIVTVPVSILKGGDITFTPALPGDKITALSHMAMDPAMRVFLDFKQNFWGESVDYIYGGTKGPEYFNSGVGRSANARTLSVTVQGPKAQELSALGKDVVPALLSELDLVYDGKATKNQRVDSQGNTISVVQDWSKEPYIQGGVSYLLAAGVNEDRITLAAPISNRLFFAGEATDTTGDSGTVNGALLSAERAAQELITSITG